MKERDDWWEYENRISEHLSPFCQEDRIEKLLWLILKYVWHLEKEKETEDVS